MTTQYVLDHDNVRRRPGFSGLSYSEGSDVEARLLQIVSTARRLDTFSPDLRTSITDWPSEYHFSRARHCLLRPLGIRPGDRVLELGCGCGALTRYLGEIGARVTAIEGSMPRARIAARRCHNLPSVSVYCDDLLRFSTSERFDWVLLVGVLEYAPLFSDAAQPVEHYLTTAAQFLAPQGAVVVAIENQVGLKYFNGCEEDHVGVPFFGVEGLYRPGTPATFGRKELHRLIASCGLASLEWFYPFPDYKLPTVILSSRAFSVPRFEVPDLLVRTAARDYSGNALRLFDDALVLSVLHRNGLIEELSNSFLVVAKAGSQAIRSNDPIAWSYAISRHEQFATETSFVPDVERIVVRKALLSPGADDGSASPIGHTVTTAPHPAGRLMIWPILRASASGASAEGMADAFTPWFREVLARAKLQPRSKGMPEDVRFADYTIDGGLIDCTPFNVIDDQGCLQVIDQEWHAPEDVPLGLVACRGVLHSLSMPMHRLRDYDPAHIVSLLCAREDLAVAPDEIDGWLRRELEFLGTVGAPRPHDDAFSTRGPCAGLVPEYARISAEAQNLRDEVAALRQDLNGAHKTIVVLEQSIAVLEQLNQSILASTSWRLTAPLRALRPRGRSRNSDSAGRAS